MLRFVSSKPLSDISTEILNGPQEQTIRVLETPLAVREPEQPLPEVNLVDPVVASLDDEKLTQPSPHQLPPPASTSSLPRKQFSMLPKIRPSFLSELFEDNLDNTGNLDIRDQIGQVLCNQQVLFSVLSKILGLVQGIGQLGRALSETGLTVGGESVQGGNQLGRALSETRLPFGEESLQGRNQLRRALSATIVGHLLGSRRRVFWVMGRAELKKGNLNLLLHPKEVVCFFLRRIPMY